MRIKEDLRLSGGCGPLSGANGLDRMFPGCLEGCPSGDEEMTRDLAGMMPREQTRGSTYGWTRGIRPHNNVFIYFTNSNVNFYNYLNLFKYCKCYYIIQVHLLITFLYNYSLLLFFLSFLTITACILFDIEIDMSWDLLDN